MKEKVARIIAYGLIAIFSLGIAGTLVMWKVSPMLQDDTSSSTFLNAKEEISKKTEAEKTASFDSEENTEILSDNEVDTLIHIPRDTDAEYFTPITDDYMYVLDSSNYNDRYGEVCESLYLYSFDESGNLVQSIYREAWTTPFDYSQIDLADHYGGEQYLPYYNFFETVYYYNVLESVENLHGGYTHSTGKFTDKFDRYRDVYDHDFLYSMSKPDSNYQNEIENVLSLDDFLILDYIEPTTDDYYIDRVVGPFEEDDIIILRDENIFFFNAGGNVCDYRVLRAYETAQVADEVYNNCGLYNQKLQDSMTVYDNVVIWSMEKGYIPDDYYDTKSHYNVGPDAYMSIPQLTQSQINYYLDR